MNNITAKVKDAILNHLCKEIPAERGLYNVNINVLASKAETDINSALAILKQFERKGLISNLNAHPFTTRLVLLTDAIDFREKGGFMVQEDLLKANIEKLYLEIQKLQPSLLEKGTSIANIFQGIQAGLEIFKG